MLVRCRNAGVHYGKLVGTDGFVTLEGSHRIWSWEGAFTLSEVSQKGVSQARVACEVPYLSIPMQDVAELIPMTTAAETSLAAFVA